MGRDRHEDDCDSDRVEEGDDRYRDREHRGQSRGCQHEGDKRDKDYPCAVWDRGQQTVKELRGRGDEAHRRCHTCGQHDQTENDLPRTPHRRLRGVGQETGTIRVRLCVRDDMPDEAQADVDDAQERTRNDRRDRGPTHDLHTDATARMPQRGHDNDAEGQGCDGVHRHVTLK